MPTRPQVLEGRWEIDHSPVDPPSRLVVPCHYLVTMAYSIGGACGPVTTSQGVAGRRVGIPFAMSALQGALISACSSNPQ
jgi:hypothetical protein